MTRATTRRTTLKLVGGAAVLTSCAPMMASTAPQLASPAPAPTPAPATSATPAASTATARLSDFPAVGSTQFRQIGGKGVVLVRVDAAQPGGISSGDVHLLAFSDRCTHLGCAVNAAGTGSSTILRCPCHNSTFSLTGAVTGGPASRPLDRVPLKLEGDQITVG